MTAMAVKAYWTCPLCGYITLCRHYEFDAENDVESHEFVEHNVGEDPSPRLVLSLPR